MTTARPLSIEVKPGLSLSRDDLADLTLLQPIVEKLGTHATLKRIEGADHSFHVLARSGRNDREVMEELADAIANWAAKL